MKLLSGLLKKLIKTGSLTVVDADGNTHEFAGAPGPTAQMRLTDKKLYTTLVTNPEIALGEGYMDGTLQPEGCSLYDLLNLLMINRENLHDVFLFRVVDRYNKLMRKRHQNNHSRKARANVSHHYDLSNDLYRLFLDSDMQYSCGYFRTPDDTLEQAQLQKKLHIAAKMRLEDGQNILDIGCGWGGMALTLAQLADVKVTGITLSTQQLKLARQRAEEMGLSDRVRFELWDYRDVEGPYDRIVSVGMFEHVGIGHFDAFFKKVHDLLTPDGLMLLHSIGRMSEPGSTGPWLRKYIFPGGYTPALSEVFDRTQRTRLWVTDCEIWRVHYAETLRHWRQRFHANWDKAREMNDERFCRMWDFYLTTCEIHFRVDTGNVFQMQLTKDRSAVPDTRDYQFQSEHELLDRQSPPAPPAHVAAAQ